VIVIFEAGEAHAPLDAVPAGTALVELYNKIDLAPGFVPPAGAVAVSAKTGAGMEALRRAILHAAGWIATGESVFLARERHLRALQRAAAHLEAAAREPQRWELFAEELRLAQTALADITGRFSADDLLGEIFERFCIGK
jgi:tRNA modification GTPase